MVKEAGAKGQGATGAAAWSPDSWQGFRADQDVAYPDAAALARATLDLRRLPPLVTSFEIERLKEFIADAQEGKRFVLQGGDCAESLADCDPATISNKLKILLQMSLVLVHGSKRPVVRIGRFAGQYAKPRSSATETRTDAAGASETLPSFFGDLVNRADFTPGSRAPDPNLLLEGYKHAGLTLNFIRSLSDSGFADLHHPEYWDLSFMQGARLSVELRTEYQRIVGEVGEALRFMQALGEQTVDELSRVEFFTSHEGLNLHYESSQTRTVPRRTGWYDLTTHLPWIGERTRALDGAHIEFFRGIENPVGVKLGPKVTEADMLALAQALNPKNERGKLLFIVRMGAGNVGGALPRLLRAAKREGLRVLWMSDPMHGNTQSTASGRKTRDFDNIIEEITTSMEVHDAEGTQFGGVHFELTGEDVTECIGGADGLTEHDLDRNYQSACDPRLNYRQALEMSLRIARRMRRSLLP